MLVPSVIQLFIYFIVEQGAHSKGKYPKAVSNGMDSGYIVLLDETSKQQGELFCRLEGNTLTMNFIL